MVGTTQFRNFGIGVLVLGWHKKFIISDWKILKYDISTIQLLKSFKTIKNETIQILIHWLSRSKNTEPECPDHQI